MEGFAFATQLVSSKTVLDTACRHGYGSKLLALSGAFEGRWGGHFG